jgi:hypothetical protein
MKIEENNKFIEHTEKILDRLNNFSIRLSNIENSLFDLKSEYDDIVNNISLKDKPEEIQKPDQKKPIKLIQSKVNTTNKS